MINIKIINVQYTWIVYTAVYTIQCALYTVHCTVYTLHYTHIHAVFVMVTESINRSLKSRGILDGTCVYIVINIRCTQMANVHYTLYTVQCTVNRVMWEVHCTLYVVQCTSWHKHIKSVNRTMDHVHCIMYSVQCTLYSIQFCVPFHDWEKWAMTHPFQWKMTINKYCRRFVEGE